MTVSAIIVDPRQVGRRNSPDFIFVVRSGARAEVQRDHDRERLEAQRAYLLREGAREV